MQLFSADATMFLNQKQMIFFAHKKLKNHPQKLLRKTKIPFFSLLPELPKRPKQKNSHSKMWLMDQLYKKLGLKLRHNHPLRIFFQKIFRVIAVSKSGPRFKRPLSLNKKGSLHAKRIHKWYAAMI